MRVEQLTCALGAELLNVNLGDAVRDDGLFNEIYAALLKYKVLFLRDHEAFSMRLGIGDKPY
jgi:taurine dioxygenase